VDSGSPHHLKMLLMRHRAVLLPALAVFSFSWTSITAVRAQFVYLTNSQDQTISGYSIDATTGALSSVPGSPFSNGNSPCWGITVDPTSHFVYVVNTGEVNTGSIYAINPQTGALKTESTFLTGKLPSAIVVDPLDRFASLR
jgi:DNA-binding beta-propeller fold protein YncE